MPFVRTWVVGRLPLLFTDNGLDLERQIVKVPGIPATADQSPLLVPQSGSPPGNLRRPIIRIFLGCALATIFARAICLALKGDAERRMTIRTNLNDEGGPLVIVDGAEVGYTPLPTSFTYYADREIRLIKDCGEAETFVQPTPTPGRDSLQLDFLVEDPRPSRLRDEDAIRCYFPEPGDVDELLRRAEKLRTEAQLEGTPRRPDPGSVVPSSKLDF